MVSVPRPLCALGPVQEFYDIEPQEVRTANFRGIIYTDEETLEKKRGPDWKKVYLKLDYPLCIALGGVCAPLSPGIRGGGLGGCAGQSTSCGDVKSSWGGGGRRVGQEWVRTRGAQERQRTGGGATQPHRTQEPHQERRGRVQQTRRSGAARQGRQPGQREQRTRK